MSESTRVDKWLWAARLYKTRSLAAKACTAGHVKRGGTSMKAASAIRVGDQIEIPFPDGPGTRTISVAAILSRRVSAAEAALAYNDLTSPAVLEARRLHALDRRERHPEAPGRPTKRQRRSIERLHRGYFD